MDLLYLFMHSVPDIKDFDPRSMDFIAKSIDFIVKFIYLKRKSMFFTATSV